MCHSTDASTADDLSFQVHGNESQSLGEVEHDLFNSRSLNPRGSLSPSCVNKELSECIIFPAFVIGSCRRGGADTPVKGVQLYTKSLLAACSMRRSLHGPSQVTPGLEVTAPVHQCESSE